MFECYGKEKKNTESMQMLISIWSENVYCTTQLFVLV